MEVKYLFYAIYLTIAIELVTTILRVIFHLKSAPLQKKLHWPRIHHSYPGAAFLIFNFIYPNPWLFVIGFSLVVSDLLHHLVIIPLIRTLGIEVEMIHHQGIHIILQYFTGVILIMVGIFALLTPLTPGSWLALIGLVLLIGKERTQNVLKIVLGSYLYGKLKVEYVLSKSRIG